MLPREILKIRFSETAFRALKAVLHENRQPKASLKAWILLKLLNFKMDFFCRGVTYVFTVVENNVTI